ncbi:MAG: Uma2 family endonuclease [Flammeovirgaceae bacterium]|jgi:Uma2 family endonuclease|nr:Uma2 family endonuclease [Flammeovirgaceae bacterium]
MDQIILKFPKHTQFTDDELFDFCATNDWFRIERNKSGQLIIMSPSGGTTGAIHFKIYRILSDWLESHEELGYIVDSSVGFRLPDKSVLAPDAAFVTKEKWESLTPEQQEKFPPLCPDFIIEVRSPSDSLPQLKLKMDDWVSNGCRLAWLIDPIKKNAYVYTKDGLIKTVATFEGKLEGFDVMPDLQMDLKKLYI